MTNKPKTNKWGEREVNNFIFQTKLADLLLAVKLGDITTLNALEKLEKLVAKNITQTQQETLEWVKKDTRAHFNSSENEEISEFWFNVIEWLSHTIKKRKEDNK